jgi:GNAT superfamily N-acetyltransferase
MHAKFEKILSSRAYRETLDTYTFRVATMDDVDGVVALWPEHWAESHYKDRGIEPDEPRYRRWLHDQIEYGGGIFVIAVHDDAVVGLFAYTLDHNFSVKPVAVMGSFFVRKAHRMTAVPALLMELGLQLARDDGACAFHAPLASEAQSVRALENSLLKNGFKPIGTMMGRAL